VRATATVTEVERRRVLFDIRVEDDEELIGHGTHERFVIDLPSFEDRLAAKAQQLR
jgi:fluoroacetyl-CoA thioesterase